MKTSVRSAGVMTEIGIDHLLVIKWKGLELTGDAPLLKNIAVSQT